MGKKVGRPASPPWKMTDEQRRLVESVLPIVGWFRKTGKLDWVLGTIDYDDLKAEYYYAACVSVKYHDPSRGKFSTLVGLAFWQRVRQMVQDMVRPVVSFDDFDCVAWPDHAQEVSEFCDADFSKLEAAIQKLSPALRGAINNRLCGKTHREFAESRGVTYGTACAYFGEAIAAIRKEFGVHENPRKGGRPREAVSGDCGRVLSCKGAASSGKRRGKVSSPSAVAV